MLDHLLCASPRTTTPHEGATSPQTTPEGRMGAGTLALAWEKKGLRLDTGALEDHPLDWQDTVQREAWAFQPGLSFSLSEDRNFNTGSRLYRYVRRLVARPAARSASKARRANTRSRPHRPTGRLPARASIRTAYTAISTQAPSRIGPREGSLLDRPYEPHNFMVILSVFLLV